MTDMSEPTGPEDWRELAKLTLAELQAQAFTGEPSEARTAWLHVMWAICRIRALKEHVSGKEFEDRAKLLTGYNKTHAYKIIMSGIADHVPEIWARVDADAHAADVLGVSYRYPGLNTMIGWYREPTVKVSDDEVTDDEVRQIAALVEQGKLLATIDKHAAPFRLVRDASRHTRRADKLILWLDPQGVDDDLETPMPD